MRLMAIKQARDIRNLHAPVTGIVVTAATRTIPGLEGEYSRNSDRHSWPVNLYTIASVFPSHNILHMA